MVGNFYFRALFRESRAIRAKIKTAKILSASAFDGYH